MKILSKFPFLFLALFALTFTACDDDEGMEDHDHDHEQEVITTVQLTFAEGGNTLTFKAVDADGDGGNPIVIEDVKLAPNTTYTLSVEFLDESDPADVEDITAEVAEEDAEHLVCYSATSVPAPTDFDKDANGDDLGLTATLTTGDAGTGTLQISLKHEPDKTAGEPCTTGETDVEVTFPVIVE